MSHPNPDTTLSRPTKETAAVISPVSIALRTAGICALLLALGVAAGAEPKTFDTPEAAALALVEASRAGDAAALRALVEDEYADEVFELKDPGVEDLLAKFAEGADRRLALVEEAEDVRIVSVGWRAYEFPVPIVRGDTGWYFDGEAGLDELQARRIGWNELIAMSILEDFVEAQREYVTKPRDDSAVRQYARRFLSTPGKRDGLYWEVGEGEEESPFGPLADGRLADPEPGAPYYGYHYRVLTRQGKNAPGGKHSYEINDYLLAGFAAVAWPAKHGETGVKTFLVNHYGIVYEKDLGEDTAKLGDKMKAYDPGEGWEPVAVD